MSVDLTTTYLGLTLANPLVPSASPLTGHLDTLFLLQEAGAAAVVLPSLFEEQIEHEAMAFHDAYETFAEGSAESPDGFFPALDLYNTGADHYVQMVRQAKAALAIPVIASLNGTTPGGWVRYAGRLADAGADAIELNVYLIAADVFATGAEVEEQYLRLVEAVRAAVDVPLAVKVGPYFSAMGSMARRLANAGADGLVLFNRFYQPDIDLETLTVAPDLALSTSSEMRLVLRWMALLHGRVHCSLAATTGVHEAVDAVKLVLAGADVVMVASALLRHGPGHLATILRGLHSWFAERDYRSVAQARGSLSQESSPDPAAFERANYMRVLTTYSSKLVLP